MLRTGEKTQNASLSEMCTYASATLTVRHRLARAGLFLIAATLPQFATAAPPCIPPFEVAHAKAVRVEKNGVIVLADGRAARLEGVLLPAGASDHAPQFLAEQAISALNDAAFNHVVSLAAEPPKEDRYGRIRSQMLVHVHGDEIWLQREMLHKGLARVAIAPDRGECAEELYAAEVYARREKSGIWSSPAYAVRSPSQAKDDVGTFQIVEGTVNSVAGSGGRVFLDFASNERMAFAATISTADMKRFREIGVDPFAYANQTVRVRGWIERIGHRPEIEIATPRQVEIVQTPEEHRAAR
jgi:endonuclease YncB( thermonuclease family)